jgi:hypothetical protein
MHSKTIKAGLLTVLILVGSASGAHAQEQQTITPEKRALIKELFEVTGLTQTVNSMMNMMIEQSERELPSILSQSNSRNQNMTPEERAAREQKVRETTARVNKKFREALQRLNYMQAIEDDTASIFDKHFTESELKEWIAFYKSPIGKKMVQLMPVMMSESMEKINKNLLPRLQQEITKIIEDETKLMQRESAKPLTAPPPPPPKTGGRARH